MMMRKFLFCLLVNVLVMTLTRAQIVTRFAYIQTENKQPFYVRWNNKVWSSSTTGYLILSKIKDQQINIVVGFPKNLYPEQTFTIVFPGNKDAGFLLKDFGNKGWVLYNLQSLSLVYAEKDPAETGKETIAAGTLAGQKKVEEAPNTPFGDLLVQVTQDSTIKNISVEKPQPPPVAKKEETVKPATDSVLKTVSKQDNKPVSKEITSATKNVNEESVKIDSAQTTVKKENKPIIDNRTTKEITKADNETVGSANEEKQTVETNISKTPLVVSKSSINLFANNENAGTYEYIYIVADKTGYSDTVHVSFEKEKQEIKPVVKTESDIQEPVNTEGKPAPKFLDIIVDTSKRTTETKAVELVNKDSIVKTTDQAVKDSVVAVVKSANPVDEKKVEEKVEIQPVKEQAKEVSKAVMVNTDCKNMATEKDFMNLRKKMVAEDNEDDMITAARKVFKSKCFTTDQVKNLCVLFLKDEGKYKFLDAAYAYVYDTDNFKQLGSLLTDDYYINRFNAMIKN